MARRATVLERFRREPVPTLTLVGADEFSPDTELPDPAKTGDASPKTVRAVYDALHVDCGMLSAASAAWFGAARPRNFVEVGGRPITKRFHVGGVPVAVILFPPLSAGGTAETETPTPKLLASVLAAADAASDAAIRIGISPWGFEGEFAVREALEQRYHLLLGGGPGAAFAGEVNAQVPGLIWSRADKDGRSVMIIDIMALPEPDMSFAWEWGLSMQAQEVRLTSAIPSDPHMEALLPKASSR
ncbi:hypothetical protein [uncultured Bilophila sp.]|uniref:UshA-like (seleno)protein family 2 n=1 Tax=uncultured Bilophila sp. TaxID=529385 RepID=UPI00280AED2A|nr:hypothetical protein [uncultured Bilophila sp.]